MIRSSERRRKLAIVSCYDELCGIAGYTRAIEKQLAPYVDLHTFDLDQFLVRSKYRTVQKLADRHIKEIAAGLKKFDSVNLQLEHGTLGRTAKQIMRRFRMLANAAPALSITFHTVMTGEELPFDQIAAFLTKGRLPSAYDAVQRTIKSRVLSHGIYGHLRRLQAAKPVSIIVPAKRDMRLLRDVYKLKNVHHHPLSFVSKTDAIAIRKRTSRGDFPVIENLPPEVKLVGTFGFLSAYKGFETAIKTLRYLPDNYHLLIFGGIHPQTIKREQAVDPYILKLLQTARIGQSPLDHLKESGLTLSAGENIEQLIREHPETLRHRLHFMGALPDEQFYAATSLCDAAIFPYMEVGQSSSGPISIALEMGARVIASRTNTVLAYAKYHPGLIEFFDIGNYAELASRIVARGRQDGKIPELAFDSMTNTKLYLQANGCNPGLPDEDFENMKYAAE